MIEATKDIVNEIDLFFDTDGMVMSNVDGMHMCMIHARIDASGVEHYHCTQACAVTVCVAHLYKMIKGISHKDTLGIALDSDLPHHLIIVIENHEKQTRSEARLKLLDTQAGALDLPPSSSFDVKVHLGSVVFQKMCKDMLQISDTLTIRATRGAGVTLEGDGPIGSLSQFLAAAPGGTFTSISSTSSSSTTTTSTKTLLDMTWGPEGGEVSEGEEVAQVFSLKYLMMFTKATTLSPAVVLTMTRDFPMLVTYGITGLGEISFCLVPKSSGTSDSSGPAVGFIR
jgi:hypothetical protein